MIYRVSDYFRREDNFLWFAAILFVTLKIIFMAQAINSVRRASFSVTEKIVSVTLGFRKVS